MGTEPEPQGTAAAHPSAVDPSMEDILASIRRILDEEGAKHGGAVKEADAAAAGGHEVLNLDHTMLLPEPDEALPGPIPAPPPIRSEHAVMEEPPAPAPDPEAPPVPSPVPSPMLVAPAAAAAAATSVGALLRTLASERSTAVHRGGPTIEDLVRDEMRPLLKEWLDQHLAPMVERLVRAEIERVVSRMT